MCRFYQHAPNSKVWEFGIVWGHAVSYDLIHWKRLPPALIPTEDHADAAGCFSGCCTVDVNGVPTILYTGVRLRENLSAEELPPISHDLQLPFIECQLAAFGDPGKLVFASPGGRQFRPFHSFSPRPREFSASTVVVIRARVPFCMTANSAC